ncbi:TetR/AcrR family transcriptional regulator [Halanaerobiaceae bacterium Z-7014]|uniref:TetR/AcrR family transcriptional regulator n=1 Tax=Halonatronomonas betaini TaxID=2778430 RepID=A0A931ATD1_9FIRM|nr:TetR/AcrR family transcriptional regulator [Halonatronomonas betaini]MBF8436440.1 TetR/AcrR family transcriptional regulator [Halonatronomonas betaini]
MAGNKKELILDSAIKVMAEEGYYFTKMSWIADRAGIAVGTIYNYFSSKEEVLEEIFAREFKKRLDLLAELEESPELSVVSKLELFLVRHFEEIKKNPDLGNILVREKEFPKKEGSINQYLNQIPQSIKKLLEKGDEKGELEINKPELMAAIIFGSIQGVVEQAIKLENYEMLDDASDEIIRFVEMKAVK